MEGFKSGIFSVFEGLTYSWTRWHGRGTRRYVPTARGGHGQPSRHLERGRQRGGKREWAAKTSVDRNSLMEGRTPNEGNDIKREVTSEVN